MKEKGLWFKAKQYGWGWYPSSWQGWVIMALYLFALIKGTWNFRSSGYNTMDLINLSLRVILPTIFLLTICYIKGEKPLWRWGKHDLTK